MQAKPHSNLLRGAALALVAGLSIALWSLTARAADDDAGAFITGLNVKAVAMLNDPNTSDEQKIDEFLAMVDRSFDVATMSKFVLGAHWRKASKAQRAEFVDVFAKVNFQRFLPLFAQYAKQTFTVSKVRQDDRNKRLFFVNSVISRGEAAPAKVDWRLVRRDQGFQIIDVAAEGVSMALTLRNEYGSVARSAGIDGLIAQLRDKSEIDPSLLNSATAQ